MNRRGFLKVLGALPFLGPILAKAAEADATPHTLDTDKHADCVTCHPGGILRNAVTDTEGGTWVLISDVIEAWERAK